MDAIDLEEFEQDKSIRPNELDVEAAILPDVFFKWAERMVRAKAEMERAKMKLDLIEQRLSLDCRSSPEDFGLARITEQAVLAAVHSHRKYVRQQRALYELRERYMLLEKMVAALEMKKRMIEILVSLHGQEFFAGPSIPHDLAEAYRQRKEMLIRNVHQQQTSLRTAGSETNGS